MSPSAVNRLVSWFCKVVASDIPSSAFGVHSAEVIVQGGGIFGDEQLVAYAAQHPMATDEDGYYHRPAQAAIASIRRGNPKRAAYLRYLSVRGDWEAAGWTIGLDGIESRAYAAAAITDFHHRYRAKAIN